MRRSSLSLGLALVLIPLAPACADDGPASEAEAETGGGSSETAAETETGGEPLEPICAGELSESIEAEALAAHLEALAAVAAVNGGNRAAGTPGYEASAAYVEAQLEDAGYLVTRWPFSFDRYVQFSPPGLATVAEELTVYTVDADFGVPSWSPAGGVSAAIEAVDLELGLDNDSTSGCEAEDFAGFTPGNIALVQRGGCTFASKAEQAEAAGAVATLLFNQGNTEERTGLFSGTLGSGNQLTAPVLFITYELGIELAEAATLDALTIELSVDAGAVSTDTFNVLAETPGGDPSEVVMLGAHLDSVEAGPGVNDNGSGTATVLEIARQFAACSPHNKVRFAWWGAEEWGLHGSRQWVEARTDEQLASLALYLNFDMLASPNYVRYVHLGSDGPEGSTLLHDAFVEWFEARGLSTAGAGFSGRSDYQPFVDAGVPAGGLATGAGGSKTEDQAATYGGAAGEAYDACYHQACDDQQNFDLAVLGQNASAAAHVLERFATSLGQLRSAREIVTVIDELAPPLHACGHDHR